VIKPGRKGHWFAWGFSVTGFLSLMWFLVRVIPKPSRAAYPCQRAAFPVASSFVVWLTALLGLNFAWRKLLRRDARVWQACLWCAAALAMGAFVVTSLPTGRVQAADPNNPVGTAKGVFPGRVVWVHAPEATDWAGYTSSEHWYESTHTDQTKVNGMMSKAVRAAGGGGSVAAAWDAIFHYFNVNHGRGDTGYQAGEKIAIKINLATCWAKDPQNYVDVTGTYEKRNYVDANWMNTIDNSPQMLHSLLDHLVNIVGVSQSDIYLGDPSGNLPKYMWDRLHLDFPNVNYCDNWGGNGGSQPRTKIELSSVPFNWSTNVTNWTATGGSWSPWHTTNGVGKLQDRVPQMFADATYVINFAVLKGHSTGVTLCGKNWYGALKRLPNQWYADGANQTGYSNYIHLHYSTPRPKSYGVPGLGNYRAIVDLMGHPALGGKTVLCLVDGLYAGYYSDSKPLLKWQMAPFNNDWPSSLFVSQDPVAIDSVCYDFLLNEWPNIVNYGTQTPGIGDDLEGGAEDYMYEAALANDPPSHSFYNPGTNANPPRLASLGVHEHWNNATDKKYSRNLNPATGQGIELVALSTATDLRAITQDPSTTNVCPGATVKFSVVATGEGTVTYQWQTNGVGISDDASHYGGCTAATLWVTNVSSIDAVNYRCVVTDALGSNTSSAAELTLRTATQITQHPSATNVCAGTTATFSVVATGEGTVTYQWQKDQTNIR